MSLRMYPCATPAQMRIRIFVPSSGINFSQMITHGTTIALPGKFHLFYRVLSECNSLFMSFQLTAYVTLSYLFMFHLVTCSCLLCSHLAFKKDSARVEKSGH